ncbi:zinc finger protein 1 homolog isoform X1 [Centruroides sculpturatus]|uniref:zinc finger protein 1 homolog isoform X1 n=1 Tax=Centruroides sculpturatus TaxID=218467 RepID=UPI000C6E23C5|nr:zinc finger protein 1 homolog isoform X1 [Centruroides sculpturatus]
MQSDKDKNRTHQCTVCKKTFRSKALLDDHMRSHTGEKPFKCSICGKQFAHRRNLIVHKIIHSEETPFKCKYCDFATKWKQSLMKHFMRDHPHSNPSEVMTIPPKKSKKVYKCDSCGNSYSYLSLLIRHQKSHSNERPFSCNICNKTFKYNCDLIVHRKKVHPQQETESFYKSTVHGNKVQADYLQTPSTSAQARQSNDPEEEASEEIIFTPREAEEFLEHFDIDLEIKKFETSSQLELFSEVETEEIKYICQFCGQQFSDEIFLNEHKRQFHQSN